MKSLTNKQTFFNKKNSENLTIYLLTNCLQTRLILEKKTGTITFRFKMKLFIFYSPNSIEIENNTKSEMAKKQYR